MPWTIEQLREIGELLRRVKDEPEPPLPDETATPIREVSEDGDETVE